MARRTNDADCVRQNRVVLAPVAGVKLRGGEVNPTGLMSRKSANDGGKTNSSPGRARHKPSNHCAGNAGVLRLYLYARVRFFAHPCTRDRGCSKHPAFPAPSVEGQLPANLGRESRECEVMFISHCERSEAIHASASCEMDCFAAFAMTGRGRHAGSMRGMTTLTHTAPGRFLAKA